MTRVGITGHRDLPDATHRLVRAAVARQLAAYRSLHGISSLAEGADQLFAEQVLEAGGALTAVIPSAGYVDAFETAAGRAAYRRLRAKATVVVELSFERPSEDAYWAAGRRVVSLSDVLLAVWDGRTSGGVGGTADVVMFAGERGVPTTVVWPRGCRRG
jgi:predicted Rossmann fold nucleotide-binding protein DprA/Smf involved in DNA uptake